MTALQQDNEFEGSFRLEFMGELTADILFDASSFKMQSSLENLGMVNAIYVSRSMADEQSGFTWEIKYGGNLSPIKVHGDGLQTSNPAGGVNVKLSTGRDGSLHPCFLRQSDKPIFIQRQCFLR